ncbi:hypothetical protein Y032_0119g796 [Ancylostoma ceylanicum]|uniref:Uncharacterized protein n=1 Tax=Ancylostoma ceylanicum TaxID=53326 RepID=A0A016TAZ6_9BILA|nr:hypothetical protein Y032_0119g796 [Ancylostoma ceylanicum]
MGVLFFLSWNFDLVMKKENSKDGGAKKAKRKRQSSLLSFGASHVKASTAFLFYGALYLSKRVSAISPVQSP